MMLCNNLIEMDETPATPGPQQSGAQGNQEVPSLEICMAQKANLEAIFHSVADGIITLSPELVITHANRASISMFGVPETEIEGRPVGAILKGKLWDIEDLLRETVETGLGTRERENILATPDGKELRVVLSSSRLLDRMGEPAGGVVILRDITHLREMEVSLERRTSLHAIVGESHIVQEIFKLIDQVGPTDSTVLILGESGTGKELVANAIHRSSRRVDGTFVKVNCSALSEGLLESELFGHVRGAFTGALHDRKGRFELASGGTIFLDEVGDLTEGTQVKLLRVLEEREIERVGDTKTIKIDVRIIAATHRDLKKLVQEGTFRQDLYFRLNVIPIQVPPLRERREDIPRLAMEFLEGMCSKLDKAIGSISPDALRTFLDHDWPGNVRELRNAIEHACVKSGGSTLLLEDLPRELIEERARIAALARKAGGEAPPETMTRSPGDDPDVRKQQILDALQKTGWHRGRAASLLGINRATLWRRMRRLGIEARTP
jgi:PAS domain S-box-containing protein